MSKQRRWSCNHSDAWHTINNVCKFAFMNKIPIETDIQQAVMRFWGHSQGMFIQHKSMKHMCWTNTWAGITHFLMKKSEKSWHVEHFHHRPVCASERTKPWQQNSVLDHLEGQQTLLCSSELWKRAQGSHNSPQPAILSHPSLFIKPFCLEMGMEEGIRAQLTFECAGKCW